MHIGQLEEALGMTRANIRFYEREGLLSPERRENGYRDYAETDLETLRRIKLLRRLQFSLEDIKALQRGELDLTAALRAQEEVLRRQQADMEAARALCGAMEAEAVRYQDLNAARYLEEMERLERGGTHFQSVEADSLPTVRHPWRRYFARSLDYGLCRFALVAALALGFRTRPGDGLIWDLLMLYLAWGVQFLLEPLLLSTWGTTPGKWIFGLVVRNADGGKLTFSQACSRLVVLFSRGEGWGLPIYSLYRNYKSFCACDAGEALPWEENLSYTIRDLRGLRCLGFLASQTALFVLTLLVGLNTLVPPVRRDLTVAGFVRNYNDAVLQYGMSSRYRLDEAGEWRNDVSYSGSGTVFSFEEEPPPFVFTEEAGTLTGVAFTNARAPDFFFSSTSTQQSAALLAVLPAQPGVGLHNWYFILRDMGDQFGSEIEDFSFHAHGLTVTNRVTYSGYEIMNGDYLMPIDGQTQTYHQEFSITVEPAVTK